MIKLSYLFKGITMKKQISEKTNFVFAFIICLVTTLSLTFAETIDWDSEELSEQKLVIDAHKIILSDVNPTLDSLSDTYDTYYGMWDAIEKEITTLNGGLCQRQQDLYDTQVNHNNAVAKVVEHEISITNATNTLAVLNHLLRYTWPEDPNYSVYQSGYTYWTSIQSYHQTLLPSAKAARDAAKTLLDDVEKDVNRIESELETKEALSDNYKKKMDALDVQITPLKKVRDNSDKEIARIVEEVITEHLQNHGENEPPHSHSGP